MVNICSPERRAATPKKRRQSGVTFHEDLQDIKVVPRFEEYVLNKSDTFSAKDEEQRLVVIVHSVIVFLFERVNYDSDGMRTDCERTGWRIF